MTTNRVMVVDRPAVIIVLTLEESVPEIAFALPAGVDDFHRLRAWLNRRPELAEVFLLANELAAAAQEINAE